VLPSSPHSAAALRSGDAYLPLRESLRPPPITARRERHDNTENRDTADNNDPTLAADPIDNTDPAEPTDPIDSTEPTDPIDNTDPFDPIHKIESSVRQGQVQHVAVVHRSTRRALTPSNLTNIGASTR
jgi:hypothetical protein